MNLPSNIKAVFTISHQYELHFTQGLFKKQNGLFAGLFAKLHNQPVKVSFVIDDGVARNHIGLIDDIRSYCDHHESVLDFTESIVLKGGEASKNGRGTLDRVLKLINDNNICRHSFVICIGGGALNDIVGYAATIAHRGVKLIRVPTTVLAQNDASVGVKNGMNAFGKKNFIGGFAPPFAIVNDLDFLTTLEDRDWIAGMAEAVKVSLIKDARFFSFLEDNAAQLAAREMEPMGHLIHRCAQLHMEHIATTGDPFEKGSSRPLDFGHWAAHKIEQMTHFSVRHGEAVAMGMCLDLTYATAIGTLGQKSLDRVTILLGNLGFDLELPIDSEEEIDVLMNGIEEFREHLGGRLTIPLITEIGSMKNVHEIDAETMRSCILQMTVLAKKVS